MVEKNVGPGFWKLVKRIIRENYDLLITEDLRGGYYVVRHYLKPMIGKQVSVKSYNFLLTREGYDYYAHGIWVQLEQDKVNPLLRPEAKLVGSLWDMGRKETIEQLKRVWSQARGFIFTEKKGEDLAKLSRFGWCIIEPEQGYPTRFIRKVLKQDARQVLAIHDADESGKGIYRALGFDTRRTKHLDISIDNVMDIGLRWEDVRALGLPTQLEAEKFRATKKDRCEIDSFAELKVRHGMKNPFLEYVTLRMEQEGITISPTPMWKSTLMQSKLKTAISELLENVVDPVIDEFVNKMELKGSAVDLRFHDIKSVEIEDLKVQAKLIASLLVERSDWYYERDYHGTAIKEISSKMRELMGEKNE